MRNGTGKWPLTLLAAAILFWSAIGTEFNLYKFLDIENTLHFLQTKWFPPDWSVFPRAVQEAALTIQIAVLGTFIGLVFAFPLSFLAAWNTAPFSWETGFKAARWIHGAVFQITRIILNFFRSVPEIVWGLILIPTFGLGPFPAVIAIAIHNIGVLGKLIAELIEASEEGPQEAIQSVGAPKLLVILYGIVPQILPNILSHYFYRLEVGVRASLILGFIGAGGIGNMLFVDWKIFRYPAVTVEVLVFMILVFIIDAVGSIVRKRVI